MFRLFIIKRAVNDKMSSMTVTLSGTDPNALVSNFFPPLELTDGEWYAGLLDFTTYNSIPNVESEKNNVFPIIMKEAEAEKVQLIEIPTGAYEIYDIEKYMKKQTGIRKFSLRPNNNTLQCELYCSCDIEFGLSKHSIGEMLGFTSNRRLQAYKWHTSDIPVNIIRVNTLLIRCNIVQDSYKDGENQHILHSFYPTVEPGFKIVETPTNVIYLPVNVQRVDNITLSVLDQAGDIVNFRGEVITVRLHLKKV